MATWPAYSELVEESVEGTEFISDLYRFASFAIVAVVFKRFRMFLECASKDSTSLTVNRATFSASSEANAS
jgi:hypothetical protein